ncbi:MAG: hypothetical protein L3K26_08505 [Candidatus Hydrogenedentes bacterium]|nr:hypothetical protein [Candidatus Hydrogenedentota bacterium]
MTETKKKNGWILIVGLSILASLCIAWGGNQWQLHALNKELDGLAQEKIATLRPSGKELPVPMGRIAAEVTVAKPYVLFGSPVGKISVYVEQKSLGDSAKIVGYDFFYERQPDASWRETESGACASEQCSVDGKRVLDAFGETL